jgi:hypothetical protein
MLLQNEAIGGVGGEGIRDGDALGGALAGGGSFGSSFTGTGTITVSDTLVAANLAQCPPLSARGGSHGASASPHNLGVASSRIFPAGSRK